MKTSKDLQSNVIDFLRFPLIVGVLFIHNTTSTVAIPGAEFGNAENLPIFYICSNFFSQILGRVAVPLFFFISGFLFFQNIDGFTKQAWLGKLKNRGKTLLIPYLFWNITAFIIYYIARNIPVLEDIWLEYRVTYTFQYVLESLGILQVLPLAGQFWFVHDLIVAVILTPAIYFFIRKAKIYGVLLLGVLWFFSCWPSVVEVRAIRLITVFFFTAGAWFGSNKRNIVDNMGKVKYWSYTLYPLLVIADFLTQNYAANSFIHNAGIIVGIVFWVNLVAYLLRIGKVRVNRFLTSSSFFVFAIHDPFLLSKLRRALYMILNPQSDWLITLLYFLIVLVVVFIALGLYYILRRFLPEFTAIITGGR
jgi:surface polysaccharide O-acyltransferase-like enzyme